MTTQTVVSALDRDLQFGPHAFRYYVRSGDAWPELLNRLAALRADQYVLITDEKFPRAKAEEARTQIATLTGRCELLTFPASEAAKNAETYVSLSTQAEERAHVTTASCIIGLGGGLVNNVAGFLAATLFRGIKLVQLPTTLLSMADVMPSLKQAINTPSGKNHLGAYYAPEFIWNDLSYLQTLPVVEVQAALCEMVKFILSIPAPSIQAYDTAVRILRPDAQYSLTDYLHFLRVCIDAKAEILRRDPHEQTEGLIFEYGHTLAHAIELLSYQGGRQPITHGLAVGLGMLVAARVSSLMGMLSPQAEAYHLELLRRVGALTSIPLELETNDLLRLARLDNKRGRLLPLGEGMYNMVLLSGLRQPNRTRGTVLTQVREDVLRQAIDECRRSD